MRYTLYGEGEGLTSDEEDAFVAALNGVVTDVSISARKAGVRIGWSLSEASSMMPGIRVLAHPSIRTRSMERIYQLLWNTSPFVQTVDPNAFFMQIPATHPPLQEVLSLLKTVDSELNREQRFRSGFAENPFLAQALVLWSRLERIPGAGYYRVGRQQFVVSPGVLHSLKHGELDTRWIATLPLAVAWFMPPDVREKFHHLGIERLRDMASMSEGLFLAHFGKQAFLWRNLHEQEPGGRIQANYPPLERRVSWRASIGEYPAIDVLEPLFESMANRLCHELQRASAGALGLAMEWRTDEGSGTYERLTKKPVYQPLTLLVQLTEGRDQIFGKRLESLDLYVHDLRPLETVQSGFLLYENAFYPLEADRERARLKDIQEQLLKKFPSLKMGASPNFRERRLDAILRG